MMTRPSIIWTLSIGVLVSCFRASLLFAAYPLATDDAGTVTQNGYEFEACYDNCKDENELMNRSCGISFKHGVTDRMDIGISFPMQVDPAANGQTGEATLGFKFALIKDMVAVTFSNELGEKDYFMNAVFSREFSFVKYNINAGYASAGDTTVAGRRTGGFSAEFPIRSFDVIGEVQSREGGAGSGLAGLRYHASEHLFIAAGVSKSFKTVENRVTGGFHFEF
jgi:hypothetical protein